MNSLLAASLFDNPWVVAIIVIGGMIANWLAQRRKAQQAEDPEPTTTNQPPSEFDMEATLRRLLGEKPPVITPAAEASPEQSGMNTSFEIPAPIAVSQPTIASYNIPAIPEPAARLERLNEPSRSPVKAQDLRRSRHQNSTSVGRWRSRAKLREAFVASLVFAPPKGLEES